MIDPLAGSQQREGLGAGQGGLDHRAVPSDGVDFEHTRGAALRKEAGTVEQPGHFPGRPAFLTPPRANLTGRHLWASVPAEPMVVCPFPKTILVISWNAW